MIGILDVLGLHVNDIEHAWNECEDALTRALLKAETDTLEDRLKRNLEHTEAFSWKDTTNSLIEEMFCLTKEIIQKDYPELNPDYYINGYDSHFYLNDDGQFEELYKSGIDAETVKKIVKADLLANTGLSSEQIREVYKYAENAIDELIKVYENGDDITIYESIEELGADNLDNGCREEDDTDESFGNFLIQAYKDGCSNTMYIPLKDGSIIAAPLN